MARPAKPISQQHVLDAIAMLEDGLTMDQASWDVSVLRGARDARGKRRQDLMVSPSQLRRAIQACTKTGLHQNPEDAEAGACAQMELDVEARRTEPQSNAPGGPE